MVNTCPCCSAPSTMHVVFECGHTLYEARRCNNSFCQADEIAIVGELLDVVVGTVGEVAP
jgi:hypothetical protein